MVAITEAAQGLNGPGALPKAPEKPIGGDVNGMHTDLPPGSPTVAKTNWKALTPVPGRDGVIDAWTGMKLSPVDFSDALRAMKAGRKIRRQGWNGKDMWLAYSPGTPKLEARRFWSPHNRAFAMANGGTADVLPCITMKNAQGKIVVGWLASQEDMLAEDWEIIE